VSGRVLLKRSLVEGMVLNLLITVLVYGAIWLNPLVHVADYPPDIQAAVGDAEPPTALATAEALLCVASVVVVVGWSNAKLRRQLGGRLPFWAAFANSALICFFFAVWDLVVLDWLIFVTIQPGFIVIPGTEGLAGYSDYLFHLRVSFLGWVQWVAILAGGLVLAGLAMIRVPRRGGEGRSGSPIRE
jgi:hypothetical protein